MYKTRVSDNTLFNVKNFEKVYIQIQPDQFVTSDSKITLLWFDISRINKTCQFVYCSVAVFFFYLLYGYLLELIFTIDGLKSQGWYVTLVQFAYYSIFGLAENLVTGAKRQIPLKMYLLLAALTLGTVGLSNSSLEYLNYPTQVIFKCCKLIPVMIGGILIQKKKFGILDFLAAISMCVGLAWFTLADSYISPKYNIIGVTGISVALLCDAVIGNLQEKVMNAYNVTNAEIVLYSYSIGFLYLLILMVFSGKFFSGFYFSLNNPVETYGYGLLFSASGYLGIQIVLTLVKSCGALAAATVTTCRKAVSVVLSFIFFSKPFTISYFWSGLLVLLGIYLNIHSKNLKNVSFYELKSNLFLNVGLILNKIFNKRKSVERLNI